MALGAIVGVIIVAVLGVAVLQVYLWIRRKTETSKPVGKQPPIASGSLPFIGAGLDFIKNPRVYLNTLRQIHGDYFILQMFGLKLFFVFDNKGLEEFYRLPEKDASFTEATRGFLGIKVPEEILTGTLRKIYQVLKRDFVKQQLKLLNSTMIEEINSLPATGTFEVFSFMKNIVHKVGFRSWCGEEAASPKYLSKLIENFEKIDPEQGFKNPSSLLTSILTKRSSERSALHNIRDILKQILHDRKAANRKEDDMLEHFEELYSDQPTELLKYEKVATDAVVLHLASQSNLYAAVSWTFINLLENSTGRSKSIAQISKYFSEAATRQEEENNNNNNSDNGSVAESQNLEKDLQELEILELCFYESIRIAQQSLTLRLVMNPIQFESSGYVVVPGYYVATLLSCTNIDEGKIKEGEKYEPEEHYENGDRGVRVKEEMVKDGGEYAVSTFGHGVHACPGKKFAVLAVKLILAHLFHRLEIKAEWEGPVKIIDTQMGAVGRATGPVMVSFTKKKN